MSCSRTTARSAFIGATASAKAQLIRPGVAYCTAGKVNSADKLYLVIELLRLDTARSSTAPGPADNVGVLLLHLLARRKIEREPSRSGRQIFQRDQAHGYRSKFRVSG